MGGPGRAGEHGTGAQGRLRAALGHALRRQDSIAVAALRSTLSALGNAEAVTAAPPAAGASSPYIAGGAGPGLGAGEAPRRNLTGAQAEQIIQAEIAERRQAAHAYERAGHPGRAQRLRAEADVIESAAVAGEAPSQEPG